MEPELRDIFDVSGQYSGIGDYGHVLLKKRSLGEGPDFCPYFRQYAKYTNSDVFVMNAQKFKVETWINRIPDVPLLVLDESDHFLDSLCPKVTISEKRINSIKREVNKNMSSDRKAEIINSEIDRLWNGFLSDEISPIRLVDGLNNVLEELDWSESLMWSLGTIIRFDDWVAWEDKTDNDDNPSITYYIANPEPMLKRLLKTLNSKVLLMSATPMKKHVHREIFGIDPVEVVGEPNFPGTLVRKRTDKEVPVTYKNWNKNNGFKRDYKDAREEIL
jgi:hypothetical protein